MCLPQIRCGHTHIDVGRRTLARLLKRCIMNNRSHAGTKPVLSLSKSSRLMARCMLPCWPVMLLEEYILRKNSTFRLCGALILQMDVRRGTFFFCPTPFYTVQIFLGKDTGQNEWLEEAIHYCAWWKWQSFKEETFRPDLFYTHVITPHTAVVENNKVYLLKYNFDVLLL